MSFNVDESLSFLWLLFLWEEWGKGLLKSIDYIRLKSLEGEGTFIVGASR